MRPDKPPKNQRNSKHIRRALPHEHRWRQFGGVYLNLTIYRHVAAAVAALKTNV